MRIWVKTRDGRMVSGEYTYKGWLERASEIINRPEVLAWGSDFTAHEVVGRGK